MPADLLSDLIDEIAERLGDNDAQFLRRVYATPAEVYAARVSAIGFVGHPRVLDAGCGFGQWSLALARANGLADAADASPERLAVLDRLASAAGVRNVRTRPCRIEALPFPSESFNAVLCYGVIFLTDWKRALGELRRVLRPGGRLYVTGCGLGWYLHLWKNRPNRAADHDPRETAARSFLNTLEYQRAGTAPGSGHVIVGRQEMARELCGLEMEIVASGDEGTITVDASAPKPQPFFRGEYEGHEGCYELLAERSDRAGYDFRGTGATTSRSSRGSRSEAAGWRGRSNARR